MIGEKLSLILCGSHERAFPHVHMNFERRAYDMRNEDACRHCVMEKEEKDNYRIGCFKEKTFIVCPTLA